MPIKHRIKRRVIERFRTHATQTLDLILPPRCIGTGEIVGSQGMISPTLWKNLQFIGTPQCQSCGIPFDVDLDGSAPLTCAPCMEQPMAIDNIRSALAYNDASRRLLLRCKYGDQQHAAAPFAVWIKHAGANILPDADLLVPVPLHWRRQWSRRFNQSALLARALSSLTDIPCMASAMVRKRFTGPQKGLSKKAREKNVRMAFDVKPGAIPTIKGKHIVLIDDVITSGATLNACAKRLKAKGARKVSALTVARVMPNTTAHIDGTAYIDGEDEKWVI